MLIGALLGFALTRDTTTDVPAVTGNQLNVAIALLEQNGFKVGEISRVQREVAVNTVLEQDPPAGKRLARLRLPQLLLLEAEGGADGQRRPGQRQGAGRAVRA